MAETQDGKPDPTILTTEALHREILNLKESLRHEIHCQKEIFESRLAAAIKFEEERFQHITKQFEMVETSRVEQKADTKSAVDAALTAQKEAVREQTTASERSITKSETTTKEQIAQLATLFQTTKQASDEKISDLKNSVTTIEGRTFGAERQERRIGEGWGYVAGGIGMLVAIATLLVTVLRSTPR